jgi:hypothetical protein
VSVWRIIGGLLLVSIVACCANVGAVEVAVLRQSHPWARFRPGSWKKVRLVTETLDAQGKVVTTSIARTRTTLSSVGDDGATLKVEATIELAGKQIDSEPQTVKQGWHGDVADRETKITDLGEDQITIAGARIPCRVEQADLLAAGVRIVTKTWFSDRVSPYILRRESTSYDSESGETVSQTQVEVVALSRPIRLARRRRHAAELRIVHTHAGGTTCTTLWSTPEIPGGVVAHESKEFDADGRLARRSKLDLIGYFGEFTAIATR